MFRVLRRLHLHMRALALGLLFSATAAHAEPSLPTKLVCSSASFPTTRGGTLELELPTRDERHPGKATLVVHDEQQHDGSATKGTYIATAAENESQNPVIYLNWSSGISSVGSPRLPYQLVLYGVASNYAHDRTVFLGVISWLRNGDKLEKHVKLTCV